MNVYILSLKQPWASIVIYGPKWCENRSKRSNHVGELWIHASERWDDGWERPADPEAAFGFPCPTSVLLGRTEMLGCWTAEEVESAAGGQRPEDERLWASLRRLAREPSNFFGWEYVAGPECYLLADRIPLAEPIPMKGKLGVWTVELPGDALTLKPRVPKD